MRIFHSIFWQFNYFFDINLLIANFRVHEVAVCRNFLQGKCWWCSCQIAKCWSCRIISLCLGSVMWKGVDIEYHKKGFSAVHCARKVALSVLGICLWTDVTSAQWASKPHEGCCSLELAWASFSTISAKTEENVAHQWLTLMLAQSSTGRQGSSSPRGADVRQHQL